GRSVEAVPQLELVREGVGQRPQILDGRLAEVAKARKPEVLGVVDVTELLVGEDAAQLGRIRRCLRRQRVLVVHLIGDARLRGRLLGRGECRGRLGQRFAGPTSLESVDIRVLIVYAQAASTFADQEVLRVGLETQGHHYVHVGVEAASARRRGGTNLVADVIVVLVRGTVESIPLLALRLVRVLVLVHDDDVGIR
ncbi:hypothetical protein PENTCL1PPCAC_7953, partial [Pristionchus entomophagus]